MDAYSVFIELSRGYISEYDIYYKDGSWKGIVREMPNGPYITYRTVSNTDGTPTIQIQNINEDEWLKDQRVHFAP